MPHDRETHHQPPLARDVDCDVAMANLFEFIDAELEAQESVDIREHILDCPTCSLEEELSRRIKGVVQRTCVQRAPQTLRAKVVERLAELRSETA